MVNIMQDEKSDVLFDFIDEILQASNIFNSQKPQMQSETQFLPVSAYLHVPYIHTHSQYNTQMHTYTL